MGNSCCQENHCPARPAHGVSGNQPLHRRPASSADNKPGSRGQIDQGVAINQRTQQGSLKTPVMVQTAHSEDQQVAPEITAATTVDANEPTVLKGNEERTRQGGLRPPAMIQTVHSEDQQVAPAITAVTTVHTDEPTVLKGNEERTQQERLKPPVLIETVHSEDQQVAPGITTATTVHTDEPAVLKGNEERTQQERIKAPVMIQTVQSEDQQVAPGITATTIIHADEPTVLKGNEDKTTSSDFDLVNNDACKESKSSNLLIPEIDDEEDCCPTCLEGYDEENPKILTKCKHHYHLSCILEWMERSATCPICDKVMLFDDLVS